MSCDQPYLLRGSLQQKSAWRDGELAVLTQFRRYHYLFCINFQQKVMYIKSLLETISCRNHSFHDNDSSSTPSSAYYSDLSDANSSKGHVRRMVITTGTGYRYWILQILRYVRCKLKQGSYYEDGYHYSYWMLHTYYLKC